MAGQRRGRSGSKPQVTEVPAGMNASECVEWFAQQIWADALNLPTEEREGRVWLVFDEPSMVQVLQRYGPGLSDSQYRKVNSKLGKKYRVSQGRGRGAAPHYFLAPDAMQPSSDEKVPVEVIRQAPEDDGAVGAKATLTWAFEEIRRLREQVEKLKDENRTLRQQRADHEGLQHALEQLAKLREG